MSAAADRKLRRLSRALQRRYPDVRVEARRVENDYGYTGWLIKFEAESKEALIETGHFSELHFSELRGARARRRDEWGHHRYAGSLGTESRPHFYAGIHVHEFEPNSQDRQLHRRLNSQKLHKQVERLLRPFVTGAWRSQAADT